MHAPPDAPAIEAHGLVKTFGETRTVAGGGEVLHEWAFGDDPADRELLASTGWGADGPTGAVRLPVVVTHEAAAERPDGGVYEFVTAGIHTALERAKALAATLPSR